MRIIFIGSQNIGYNCLKEIIRQNHQIILVCTAKPDPHEIVWYKSVEELARRNKLSVEIQPDLKSSFWIKKIKSLKPDLICIMGWRRLIATEILKVPTLGTVGIHFSLLPKGRGFAPVNWAIIKGLKETGATLFYVVDKMDEGDIIGQVKVKIYIQDTAKMLNDKLTTVATSMFAKYLPKIITGKVRRMKQNNSRTTYHAKRLPEDGKIDWLSSAKDIYNLIRALSYPYPGAYGFLKEKKIIIWKASLIKYQPSWTGTVGQIIQFEKGGVAVVITGKDLLQLDEVQVNGDIQKHAGDVINSLNIRLT